MRSAIYFVFAFFILVSCRDPVPNSSMSNGCCGDTIQRTVVKKFPKGGELVEQQVITFTQNDLSVPMDSLYYNAEGSYPEMGQGYRIYFNRNKVIAFCDSMLQALGRENLENFNDIATYRSICDRAHRGWAEVMYYNETHQLINRFTPLIVHQKTGHKPSYYFTIHSRSTQREDVTRHFVSQKGDTLELSWEVIWVAPLSEIEE